MFRNLAAKLVKSKYRRSFIKRLISDEVRVRFAPSPTGNIHLGGLRTALYNHLFAKSKNGVTILRIEDTDFNRKVPSAEKNIVEDLEWCGLKYDEGPYFQSERQELYEKFAKQLLEQGDAYYCFCSSAILELKRKEAIQAREIPKYDNCCRTLPKEEVESRLKNGESACIRFKLSTVKEPFIDLVYGSVLHDVAAIEGDFVIIKNDGWPTYHFANVVDDHLMNVTHVLRGVEWQVSTSKHILLYRAFKWEVPQFGHLPLLQNPNGTKLSKRQGDAQVRFLRDAGYFPNALLNFLISFGGGFNVEQKEKVEQVFTFDELVEKFDIKKIKASSCQVHLEKLNFYNGLEIKRQLESEEEKKSLLEATRNIVRNNHMNSKIRDELLKHDESLEFILKSLRSKIKKLDELNTKFQFLWVWQEDCFTFNKDHEVVIEKVIDVLENVEWDLLNIKRALKLLAMGTSLPMDVTDIKITMRLILCGGKGEGPAISELLVLMGKKESLFRLSKFLEVGRKKMLEKQKTSNERQNKY